MSEAIVLESEIRATFGREFRQMVETSVATVNAGAPEQLRSEAFEELMGLHYYDWERWVVDRMVHAYLTPRTRGDDE